MRSGWPLLACATLLLGGCNRHQSTLSTFGVEAREIRSIAIVLLVGAIVILIAVSGLYWRAVHAPENSLDHKGGMRMVLWLGAIVPTIVLAILLLFALPAMRPRPVAAGDMVIRVEGEQFWWRVAYRGQDGAAPFVSANEVRIPVGRTVAFQLTANEVIHSFWIPGLAGKMDMIPGRITTLPVRAEKAGRYRGVCAEFCGLSHALMAFDVIAMEPAAFDAWLAKARAQPPKGGTSEGARLFAEHGCGGCHSLNGGTSIGPALGDFAGRGTLGAGILPPTTAHIAAFIRAPHKAKPGVRMPAYPHLSDADARAIATWLREAR